MSEPLAISSGRRFSCTRCGNCCRQDGWVYFSPGEAERMAAHLDLSLDAFEARFDVQWDPGAEQLAIEATGGRGCPLLRDDGGCSVHPVKPHQCRSWPFWDEMLDDAARWQQARSFCPGLDADEGRLYGRSEILAIRDGEATDENVTLAEDGAAT